MYVFFLQQQSNPSMYPPAQRMAGAGNGSFPTPNQGNQFPPPYNNSNPNQMPNYPGWNNQCAGQQPGQQGYTAQPNFSSYTAAAAQQQRPNNNNFEYNNGQWPGNTNPTQWNNGWQPQEPAKPGATSTNSAPSCDNNSANNYQRTFDYVQQCQTWTAQ